MRTQVFALLALAICISADLQLVSIAPRPIPLEAAPLEVVAIEGHPINQAAAPLVLVSITAHPIPLVKEFVVEENHELENMFTEDQLEALQLSPMFLKKMNFMNRFDSKAVVEVVRGLLEGASIDLSVQDFHDCIVNVGGEVDLINEAVKLFISKNPESVKTGLNKLGQALQMVPQAISACNGSIHKADILEKMLIRFRHPKTFFFQAAKNLMVNGVEIIGEIKTAVEAFNNKDWRTFGFNIGRSLTQVFLKSNEKEVLLLSQDPNFASIVSNLRGSIKNAQENKSDFLLSGKLLMNEDLMTTLDKATNKTWTHQAYEQFQGLTNGDIQKRFLGLYRRSIDASKKVDLTANLKAGDIPTAFDARTQWPACIHPIRNQMHCGSCWAFAGSETISDRFCIASETKVNVVLSPQYMVSCDSGNYGCEGGILPVEWDFLEEHGTVTDSCWGYHSGTGTAPSCASFKKCEDGTATKNYYVQKASTKSFENQESLQSDLLVNGPVETGFDVYADFMTYKSGVYQHVTGDYLGGHAVKIVGWGLESGTKYWICANSWDVTWGESGFFRIAWGQGGIDDDALAGIPDLNRL